MKRNEKMSMLTDLLKKGNNRFTVDELVKAAGSERVARSSIWLSRHDAGIKLEAVRDDDELYPEEQLDVIARRIGFGDIYSEVIENL